ncbi:hypothetical protein CXZ10_06055 [Pleomorphomonas diazotrophica]|uniref:HTH cro/C1-type domain-containing protein n=1 Tax=Pleomorphomonas diazotrophica TaxID=1166257 RepID=A0A1I4Q661_9HYPH|nr:S24 family peptidase [Pleomorphomonas diazotrophica]PKR90908.1 hypothetical protein CXZ10_06055 [Pleomorphomonas diazotrophica]SFM35534.1 Phage repressor protein C, contains Cro/C1-type HTH and peptisase s24 domains [Pleomorphomonas diazotrophica]
MAHSFADRLRLALDAEDVTVPELSRRSGVGESTIRNWLSAKPSVPSAEYAAEIAHALSISLQWLIAGRGEMRPEDHCFREDQARYRIDDAGISGLVVVRRLDGYALTEQEHLAEILAFPASMLTRMGLSASTARLLIVRGDSMAPTLQHGDLVLLDTTVESVKESAIFAVSVDDRVFVKRIQPRYDGSLQVVSDNPVYPPEKISATDAAALKIVGQVRWFGRSI